MLALCSCRPLLLLLPRPPWPSSSSLGGASHSCPNVLWLPPSPVKWGRVPKPLPLCLQSSVSWSAVGALGETQTPPASGLWLCSPVKRQDPGVGDQDSSPRSGETDQSPRRGPGCEFCFPPMGDADRLEGSQMWSRDQALNAGMFRYRHFPEKAGLPRFSWSSVQLQLWSLRLEDETLSLTCVLWDFGDLDACVSSSGWKFQLRRTAGHMPGSKGPYD